MMTNKPWLRVIIHKAMVYNVIYAFFYLKLLTI